MTKQLPKIIRLTKDEQLMSLKMLVPDYALGERRPGVAGGKDWTPHEWVTYALDTIFGPDRWSVRIGQINPMTTPAGEMYIYVPIELTVTFADGAQCIRSDVGVGFVRFTRDAKANNAEDLSDTPLDNFSTGYKSAVTSGIKGCCRDLGRIFIPMQNEKVTQAIRMETLERELTAVFLPPPENPKKQLDAGKKALGRDDGDLTAQPDSIPHFDPLPAGVIPQPESKSETTGDVKVKQASIKTPLFPSMIVKLQEATPYYNDSKTGKANNFHVLKSAAKIGYSEITAENIDQVLADLIQHATDNTVEVPA